jgi:hypothetical protein
MFADKEERIVESGDIRLFFSYIKRKMKSCRSIPPLLNYDRTLIVDTQEKTNVFCNFFASTFTSDDGQLPNVSKSVNSETEFSCVHFTPEVVTRTLKSLPSKLSTTPDDLPPFLLRNIADAIAYPLCSIFNLSMSTGVLPSQWKLAFVSPIFKGKGLSSMPNNYRPISLTSCCCKTMEKIIVAELICYLLSNNLISDRQHGFLPQRSTITQLLESLIDWTMAVETRKRVDCVYVDLSRAFDSVSHPKLLLKLQTYGLTGKVLSWICNFLCDRKQCVVINGTFSDSVSVSSGVPQGSVLGPILFLLYMNDVTNCLQGACKVNLYADDAKFYLCRDNDDASDLVSSLNRFEEWVRTWQLKIAPEKCFAFSVGERFAPMVHYDICKSLISTVSKVRDLGVTFSSNLKFSDHCASIVSVAYPRAVCILKCFVSSEPNRLIKAFKAFVRPVLEYGSPIFSPFLKRDIQCVERVQKFFTRQLCKKAGICYRDYPHRLRILNLPSLEHRRLILDLCFMYNLYFGHLHLSFESFFVKKNFAYPTRNQFRNNCQIEPRICATTKTIEGLFFFRISRTWNSLPNYVVQSPSLAIFRKRLHSADLSKFCIFY